MVPEKYRHLFINTENIINTHEGWDPGAWEVAEYLGKQLNVLPIGCHTTRLLIESNRSTYNTQLFSRYTAHLSENDKELLIKECYTPYRERVQLKIDQLKKPILHLSIHSFTPVYQGVARTVELGLLYDPTRSEEYKFCQNLQRETASIDPDLIIRHNEPYLGIDDGFTSYLRSIYGNDQYLGIEIEISQKFAGNLAKVEQTLARGIKKVLFP